MDLLIYFIKSFRRLKMSKSKLNYKVYNKKAASIYIAFKASASSSHSCDAGGHWLEVAGSTGSGDPYRIKLSATLRVDDIQLNY